MSNKKYNRIKKRLITGASGGILAGMILVGGSAVYADTVDSAVSAPVQKTASTTGMHLMHRWNSSTKAGALAGTLGLSKSEVKQELKSGKTMKQILQDHGIVPGQLNQAYKTKNKKNRSNRNWPLVSSTTPPKI